MVSRATTYVIAIGSNRPISRRLTPGAIVARAHRLLDVPPLRLLCQSPLLHTAPLGPARRRFVNAAVIVETALPPPDLLKLLKNLEHMHRRRPGRRWGDRSLDLDIILWSEGRHSERKLKVPHSAFRQRRFVLNPIQAIAARWRDPVTGLTMRQLAARARKPKPVDRGNPRL